MNLAELCCGLAMSWLSFGWRGGLAVCWLFSSFVVVILFLRQYCSYLPSWLLSTVGFPVVRMICGGCWIRLPDDVLNRG